MDRRHRGDYADGELDEGIAPIVKILQENGVEDVRVMRRGRRAHLSRAHG